MIRPRLRRRPVSLALAAITLLVSIATGSAITGPRPEVARLFGIDPDALLHHGDVLGLLTSVLLPENPAELIAVLLVLVLVVGLAEERLMGSWRVLVAYVVSAVVGTGGGMALQLLGVITRRIAEPTPGDLLVLDPFTPVAGVLLAASSFTGPLWRRRIRVLGITALVVVLLYSGRPGDLYRLVGGLAGLLLGALLARHRPIGRFLRSSHHEARSLVASLVAVTAVGPFVSVIAPHGYGLLRPLGLLLRSDTPEGVGSDVACRSLHPAADCAREIALVRLGGPGALALSALPLLVLAVAAFGMWRGRRVAAIAAIVVELLLGVLAAVYFDVLPLLADPDQVNLPRSPSITVVQAVLGLLVPLGMAVVIAINLRHFDVRSSVAATRLFVGITVLVLLGCAVLYVVGGLAVRHQFSPVIGLVDLLGDLPERFVPVGFLRLRRLDFIPVGPIAHLLWDWVGPLAWTVLLVGLALCTATVRDRAVHSDVARVRALLRQGSVGPVAYMSTWPGSRYWFAAGGRHAVAYREINGVALTLGEPVGPEEGGVAAAREFAVFCDDNGLTPVFYTVRPSFAAALGEGRPWASVVIAEDTVLHPATFRMTGKRWADVRSSINRADREGVHAVWTDWEHCTLPQRTQIEAISEEWVAERQLPELGFTLGGVDELRDPEVRLMLAVGPEDRIEAVTSWLPAWRDGELVGLTLDFMRRRPRGMNGVMEFLIASVALQAQQRGLAFVSLSAAPLAVSAEEDTEPGTLDRLLATLSRLLEPAYGFKSLAAFKDKFQPTLQPLVMAYPDAVVLPAVGVALTRAYLPELTVQKMLRLVRAVR